MAAPGEYCRGQRKLRSVEFLQAEGRRPCKNVKGVVRNRGNIIKQIEEQVGLFVRTD